MAPCKKDYYHSYFESNIGKAKATAHRWLSWLSTGLSRGRSWVQLRPDQHSGSLNNWGESAAFVTTSANG